MAEYLSPGVYVEEYESSPRAIEGVGTSTAGFIGLAARGPTAGAPALVTSFADYQRQFGGFLSEYTHGEYRYLPYAVEQFFANGGTRCFISRVIPEDAETASAGSGVLTLRSANEGQWGNRIVVSFASVNRRRMQLTAKQGEGVYTARSAAGFAEGDLVEFSGELNRISAIFENTVTFERDFQADPVDTALVPGAVVCSVEMDVAVRCGEETETYSGLNLNPASPGFLGERLRASALVAVERLEPVSGITDPVSAIFGEGRRSGSLTLSGGSDGTIASVDAGTFIGEDRGPGRRTGIQAFLENAAASIIAVPGITIPEVVVSLVSHCETLQNRFAVIDVPRDKVRPGDILEYRGMVDTTYAAMYHPWVQVFDRVVKKPGFIPPSGSVAGVYSRTDMARGVHKAPANETVQCTGLSVNYTAGEQDILNPAGVNLIRALPGQGIRVWGARTAGSDASFKYVNVRRLFIYVEQSIKAATGWVVFEPNDASLWARVQMTVSSFLGSLFRAGMLAGQSAEEAFFVDIGPATMSRDDIVNGRLVCEIGIAPSRPAEFVIFRVTQLTAGAGEA